MKSGNSNLPAVRTAAADFEAAVGGRHALAEVLSVTARDSKQDILYRLLTDPARRADNLAKLCQDAGISATEVLSMYRDAVIGKALVQAQVTMAERLEEITRDVTMKAADHVKPCPCLDREGAEGPLDTCLHCHGTGELYREGSLKHAETVFKATGVLRDAAGGVNVNVQQKMGVNVGGSALLDSFVKATDAAAYDVIEATAEPLPEEPEVAQ